MHLSFVLPCLNEAETIAGCIGSIRKAFNGHEDFKYEIIVADNGSSDKSGEVACSLGARVISVVPRGYGCAIRQGIEASRGDYVMFADADGTYLLEDSWDLYQATVGAEADMGIASRFGKRMDGAAMPWLHRYVGTPILTSLINVFFRGRVTDCNSGFRCVRKAAYETWHACAGGMEFASELIVRALKCQAKIVEIPSGLRCSPTPRSPHLSTWRDGMRNLLLILSERPRFFECLGLTLVGVTSVLQGLALTFGPVNVMGLHVFDVHTRTLLLLGAMSGSQLYLFGCVIFLRGREEPRRLTRWLLSIDEVHLLRLILILLAVQALIVGTIVAAWASNEFAHLQATPWLFGTFHFLCVPSLWIIGPSLETPFPLCPALRPRADLHAKPFRIIHREPRSSEDRLFFAPNSKFEGQVILCGLPHWQKDAFIGEESVPKSPDSVCYFGQPAVLRPYNSRRFPRGRSGGLKFAKVR